MGKPRAFFVVASGAVLAVVLNGCLILGSTVELPISAAVANDVNGAGVVVGSQVRVGVAYAHDTTSGITTELGTLGGSSSSAIAINDAGVIVGRSTRADGQQRAFRYTTETGMVDLGTLDGTAATTGSSTANAINSDGTIVGVSTTSAAGGQSHAFVRDPDTGVMTDLGTLGGTRSEANAINDAGVIVGWSWTTGDTARHAFVMEPGGEMVDLGTLGGNDSSAEDLDESGTVVGWSVTARFTEWCEDYGFVCPQTRAFSYDLATGVFTELNVPPGVTDARAFGINEDGVVVGHFAIEEIRCAACPIKTNAAAWELGSTRAYQLTTNGVSGLSDINAGGLAVGTSARYTSSLPPFPTPFAYHQQIDFFPG